jgi:hypothetical protein
VQWRIIKGREWWNCTAEMLLWTKTSTFSTPPNMMLSGRNVRLYHTVNRLLDWPSCVKEFVIKCHYSGYSHQATVGMLLSLGYSQQVTFSRLL